MKKLLTVVLTLYLCYPCLHAVVFSEPASSASAEIDAAGASQTAKKIFILTPYLVGNH